MNGRLVTTTLDNRVHSPTTTDVTNTPAPIGAPTPIFDFPVKIPTIIVDKSGAPFPNAKKVTP